MRARPQRSTDAPPVAGLWLRAFAGGLTYALLTTLAFAPVGLWPLALLAPAPLLWVGLRAGAWGRIAMPRRAGPLRRIFRSRAIAAWVGSAGGVLPLWLYQQQWTTDITRLGYLPMCVTLALLVGLCPAALAIVVRRFGPASIAWAGPIIWAGAEIFRGEVFFTGYPWLLAAHPLIDAPFVAGAASLAGAYGVGALAVAPGAALLAEGGWRRRLLLAASTLIGLAVLGQAGNLLLPGASDRTIRVAVVQTNIPQDNKIGWRLEDRVRDLEQFLDLTRQAAQSNPDLIVWPETMFPGMTLEPAAMAVARDAGLGQDSSIPDRPFVPVTWFADELLEAQGALGIPMLVGAIGLEDLRTDPVRFGAQFNSAYALAGGAVSGRRYDKIHLTPFGEVMPYISAIPWLERLLVDLAATSMPFTLEAGSTARPLDLSLAGGAIRVATPICFEAASADTCRRISHSPRADLLVNLTNDGWFGDFDAARSQAEQIARWRAAELAIPLIRAANTGASGAFDTRARPLPSRFEVESGAGRMRSSGVLIADVPLAGSSPTAFVRGGWLIGWGLFAAAASLLIWAIAAGPRSSNRAGSADEL